MINGIGVQNFRSFEDTFIELKPITVFVGKNSSGKSSLLRTFPLFRQSLEENTTGPVLWYGRYVDFGDFSDVLPKGSVGNEIKFKFSIDMNDVFLRRYSSLRNKSTLDVKYDCIIEISVFSKNKKTKTKSIKITFQDFIMEIILDDSGNAKLKIESNGISLERDNILIKNPGQFIPNLKSKSQNEDSLSMRSFYRFRSKYDFALEASFVDEGIEIIQSYLHATSKTDKLNFQVSNIPFLSKSTAYLYIRHMFRDKKTFIKKINGKENILMDKIYPLLVGWNINDVIDICNSQLSKFFSNVKYIAPLRATSERFYRFQDLQVNEIDHTGSNLAMLLNSLNKNERAKFEEWTKSNLNFTIKVEQSGPHFEILINPGGESQDYNISDMGFGYSQVLPIITAIWLETERENKLIKKPITFIIEQPELHLHPAYQNNLARVFAKVISNAKEKEIDLKIIFETHSQSMIETLGQCIGEDFGLSNDDVSILVFQKNENHKTEVIKSYFDNEGFIQDWPIGFFSGIE